MSKTKQNIPKSKRGGYDLWAKRPMGGRSLNPFNKRMCRRVERRMRQFFIQRDIDADGDAQ